jgi:uracil-DNA glycosylase
VLDQYLTESSWKKLLESEFKEKYFQDLEKFVSMEYKKKSIFPEVKNIFNTFNLVPFEKVKVVILGQDPYHGKGQAHGLCFSVLPPTKIPPSLKNIFKEIERDFNYPIPKDGNLEKWAKQGVLLLNTILTVEEASPMSHSKKGWELFTQKSLELINDKCENIVFMAWGNPAIERSKIIDENKHLVLKTVHPSPLSAHRGYIGCSHFSMCNDYLEQHKKKKINWDLN